MSRRRAIRQLYHPPYAEQARRSPGTWVRVRAYELAPAAHFAANCVRNGTYACYRPAGHYRADIRRAGADFALWISYQPPEQP